MYPIAAECISKHNKFKDIEPVPCPLFSAKMPKDAFNLYTDLVDRNGLEKQVLKWGGFKCCLVKIYNRSNTRKGIEMFQTPQLCTINVNRWR